MHDWSHLFSSGWFDVKVSSRGEYSGLFPEVKVTIFQLAMGLVQNESQRFAQASFWKSNESTQATRTDRLKRASIREYPQRPPNKF